MSFWDIRGYCDEDSIEKQRKLCEDACLRQKCLYTDSKDKKSFNLKVRNLFLPQKISNLISIFRNMTLVGIDQYQPHLCLH